MALLLWFVGYAVEEGTVVYFGLILRKLEEMHVNNTHKCESQVFLNQLPA